jgi:hypothetical protein
LPLVPADPNTAESLSDRFERAIALSHRMLVAARAGDWGSVAAIEAERVGLLDEASLAACRNLAEPRRGRVSALLAECLRINDEVVAVTAEHVHRMREILALAQAGSPSTGSSPEGRGVPGVGV